MKKMEYRIWKIESGKSQNSKFQIPNSNSGFTLVEIIVVVAIVAVCGYIMADLFIGQNRIYLTEMAELNITNDARMALDDIDNYVRPAYRVLATYSTYTSDADTLILQVQSVNVSNQLIAATYDHVVVDLNNGSLFREVFPNAASARLAVQKKLASNVTGLVFTYNNASFPLVTEVTTDLTLEEDAGRQNRSITISSKSILRNY